mgnify:CR=1 FL=1|jgi:hypothetical protein
MEEIEEIVSQEQICEVGQENVPQTEPQEIPTQEQTRIDHSAIAFAVEPFQNIKVVKKDGKLVIKDLEVGISPLHKICKAIKNFFVDRKPKDKDKKGE